MNVATFRLFLSKPIHSLTFQIPLQAATLSYYRLNKTDSSGLLAPLEFTVVFLWLGFLSNLTKNKATFQGLKFQMGT